MEQQNAYDQAEHLRNQVNDWKQRIDEQDALSLPPRSEVHKQKQTKKRVKWKLKYPVIRLLTLFFILLPISILSIYYLHDDKPSLHVVTMDTNSSYEPIDIVNQEEEQAPPVKQTKVSKEKQTEKEQSETGSSSRSTGKKEDVITHTVQENETLFSIAMKYYQSAEGMDIIKKWNHLESSQLHKGQVLQIPLVDTGK
ncbi:LysM peptidoglycan-binding domain-containing protein [Thermaerobacillus caldiproteolyticus]|uniref:LysM peptidoglycan-binding domain-containing protein n=1 Tax=Thermaerobacillus caldiproteolyticus TaxID=247480 RepID=UPI00188DB5DF|nr:LysM peptidoglycan-binding domain-containing protein [Anoxybacillus caldiproteolyticus]QPA33028.1 LysM peptidoglycan-binding domain-containing protein [Anoxybacillus caldiproteolyticus]